MLKHFLITGFRNFWRNKSATLFNILGLAIGLTTIILILEYIINEISYDRFHKDSEQIYRVIINEEKEAAISPTAYLTAAVAPSMAEEFPEVKNFARFSNPSGGFISFGEEKFRVEYLTYTDSAFFDIFSFPLLSGNPGNALSEPYQVVLTRSLARKIFGNSDPIGKVTRLNGKDNLVVTGILDDFPANSTLKFDALVSISTLYLNPDYYLDWDGGYNYLTYIKTVDGTDIDGFKKKFPDFMENHINYKYRQFGFIMHLDLQPLKRIHLYSQEDFRINEEGDLQALYIFSSIAIFILIIACINFMNLSTARSFMRSREIGLRKVSGAGRRSIILQFLFETLIVSIIACIISIILADLLQPEFNRLIGKDLTLFGSTGLKMAGGMLLLVLVTSLLAGSYPAWYISRFPPLFSVKGTMISGKGKSVMRNILVVFQFLVSVVLIILTLVVYQQMRYVNARPLGYNKEEVVVIPMVSEKTMLNYPAVKDALGRIPQVIGTGASSEVPGFGFTMNGYFPERLKEPMMIHVLDVDADYMDVMNIPVVQGRNFDKISNADSSAYLINESLARKLGWQDPVGKSISRNGKHTVIGVVADFHFNSLHQPVQPLIITKQPWIGYNFISARIQPGSQEEVLRKIESAWKTVIPDEPFDYFMQGDFVKNSYSGVRNAGEAILWFSFLAIFVAGLGLLALANFTFNMRKKEIGIRKVLGAESAFIARRITFEFLRLVIIAGLLALPLAWWLADLWLDNFAYRTYISFWIFVLPIIFVTILAWLTIYFQVKKLANTNPVDVLKFE
jgi:putative ABC transport system permease protein